MNEFNFISLPFVLFSSCISCTLSCDVRVFLFDFLRCIHASDECNSLCYTLQNVEENNQSRRESQHIKCYALANTHPTHTKDPLEQSCFTSFCVERETSDRGAYNGGPCYFSLVFRHKFFDTSPKHMKYQQIKFRKLESGNSK